MPCESCAVQFSVFKRKRACCECERFFCSGCLRRGGGAVCAACRVLSTRPLVRQSIAHLKVRDLQSFLLRQNISTRGCVEKEELLSLCVAHVNSGAYRRRGPRPSNNPFNSLKGFSNNFNEFINSAFDLRQPPPSAQSYNSEYNLASASNEVPPTPPPRPPHTLRERFTTNPGGEVDIRVPPPAQDAALSRTASAESARVDTDDCYEIEDLDDGGWELVHRPADPLPNDSDVLLTTPENPSSRLPQTQRNPPVVEQAPQRNPSVVEQAPQRNPINEDQSLQRNLPDVEQSERTVEEVGRNPSPVLERAASELELRPRSPESDNETISLHAEELSPPNSDDNGTPQHMTLDLFKSASELDLLSVKQLKELLLRNRVEYRGCLERADLLDRAKTLWRNHAQFSDELDDLPLEDACKICMAAPLECVLLECGHIAACTACARQLSECPICRQYVVRCVRFFRC